MPNVIKRDGRTAKFDISKISNAVKNSARDVGEELNETSLNSITESVIKHINSLETENVTVEEIQNFVIKGLKENGYGHIAANYSSYREERTKVREIKSDLMKAIAKIGVETVTNSL